MKTTKQIIIIYQQLSSRVISRKYVNFLNQEWFSKKELRDAFLLGLNNGSENNFKELVLKGGYGK